MEITIVILPARSLRDSGLGPYLRLVILQPPDSSGTRSDLCRERRVTVIPAGAGTVILQSGSLYMYGQPRESRQQAPPHQVLSYRIHHARMKCYSLITRFLLSTVIQL